MNCNKCGSPLNPDSKFCNVCGAEIGQNVTPVNPSVQPVNNGVSTVGESVVNPVVNSNNNDVNLNVDNGVGMIQSNTNEMQPSIDSNVNQVSIQPSIDSSPMPNETNQVQVGVVQSSVDNGIPVMNEINNQVPTQQNTVTPKKGANKTGLIVVIVAVVIIVGLIVVLALTGGIKFQATITSNGTTKQLINKTTESARDDNNGTTTTKPIITNPVSDNGSFNVFEKIKQIDLNTIKSYEQVVEIMGMEGVKDESSTLNKYVWTQDDKTNMEINFYVSETNPDYKSITSVDINYDRDSIKNPNVDLSNAMTIVNTINAQTPVYYNEIASSFGVEGTLVELSSYSREYVWVNANGGYVTARFNQETSQCTYIFAIVK